MSEAWAQGHSSCHYEIFKTPPPLRAVQESGKHLLDLTGPMPQWRVVVEAAASLTETALPRRQPVTQWGIVLGKP